MQKIDKKASILIWAIFFSIIMSIGFISISTKINKNIKNNWNIIQDIKINNDIKNILKWSIFVNSILANWEEIVFNKDINIWLKKYETIHFISYNTGNLNINFNNSILYYSWNTYSWIINNSWVIILTNTWKLSITNFWWYSRLEILQNNILKDKYINYKIIKNIWNKNLIKTKWKITHFFN